jgi:hypothetical protein
MIARIERMPKNKPRIPRTSEVVACGLLFFNAIATGAVDIGALKAVPQLTQKLLLSGFCLPQLEQYIIYPLMNYTNISILTLLYINLIN